MKTIVDNVEASNYVATPAQVEQLAAFYWDAVNRSVQVTVSYLRVIIVACQAKLGTKRTRTKVDIEAQQSVLDEVHSTYYAAVLNGVTTPEIAEDFKLSRDQQALRALERNRRSNFARTAKSAIDSFIRFGGDLRGINALTVTKQQLRDFAMTRANSNGAGSVIKRTEAAAKTLERRVNALAKADPAIARDVLESLIERLERVLATLPEHELGHHETTVVGMRPSIRTPSAAPPILHKGA